MEEKPDYHIVNTAAIPADKRTKEIIIRALEAALKTATGKEATEYSDVLLALKATQGELPW